MVGWHHCLNGHEFEQPLGDGEGQGSPACCSPWGCRVGHDLVTKQHDCQMPKLVLLPTYHAFLPGASVRNSACGKGHEEGGSAYAKAGSSLRSPAGILEHLPPKPDSAYFTALCCHLHL